MYSSMVTKYDINDKGCANFIRVRVNFKFASIHGFLDFGDKNICFSICLFENFMFFIFFENGNKKKKFFFLLIIL